MTSIQQRYPSAVNSNNLAMDASTLMSDSDTLAAMGRADHALTTGRSFDGRSIPPSPLAVPLQRLLAGDNNESYAVVRLLTAMTHAHSFKIKTKISHKEAGDMARACLAWMRSGACSTCYGRRWLLVPGTQSLSDTECTACQGTGKMPFEDHFEPSRRELARWAVSQLENAMGRAGPEAMKALAPRLDL